MYPGPVSSKEEWIRDSSASVWKHRGASNEDVAGSSPAGGAMLNFLVVLRRESKVFSSPTAVFHSLYESSHKKSESSPFYWRVWQF